VQADFDVVVVGAGPCGCAAALAQAQAGARVLLLEANPKASERLAGEWLHPRGVAALAALGVDPARFSGFDSGRGFVVHPDDGGAPIRLPYAEGKRGWSGEHAALVAQLRAAASAQPGISYLPGARVTAARQGEVRFRGAREDVRVRAPLVIGADGRSSRVRAELGLADARVSLSRMVGLRLRAASLPEEGFGHVFLGAPGPMLAYRITPQEIRLCLDLPLGAPADRASIHSAYAPALPVVLRAAFAEAVATSELAWAINQSRPRTDYGGEGLALVGDAVGFQHPLTAVGMTLGLCDAVELAQAGGLARWAEARRRAARVPEVLASALYEAFASDSDAARGVRASMLRLWRRSPRARARSMEYLAAEPGQLASFGLTFLRISGAASLGLAWRALRRGDFAAARAGAIELARRGRWLARGASGRSAGAPPALARPARALAPDAELALARGTRALLAAQRADGSWEGEVRWCPMLAAQFALFTYAVGHELSPERRAGLLRQFAHTQRSDGLWGLHACSPPYLFVTTLVYVAARLLGEGPDSPLLVRARRFIHAEGVVSIPSWGKLWLALLGLYAWEGVPALVPELWALPKWLPLHPSRFYCHTRHIYLAMSVLFARRVCAPDSARLRELRAELYPAGFENVRWRAARSQLRVAELLAPPGLALRIAYRLLARVDRHHAPALRARLLAQLEERLRFELRTTDSTSLSPVSGLLGLLALHARASDDPELRRAIERLDAWMWSDEHEGLRVAGARSATWDTSFALQALAEAAPHAATAKAVERGVRFLAAQQIRQTPDGIHSAFRLDPHGGFCFAGAWHGWPVSDCTAEAMEALAIDEARFPASDQLAAARFVLRCQNADGGFGSYEARRTRVGLEWLNPAEMFGESMSEGSYVECTASCIAALARFRERHPAALGPGLGRSITRAERRLRKLQRADGSWRGVWGVQFLYGTLFGIRGLRAAGAEPSDPALRRACHWLLARQRADGGWGEHPDGCRAARYVEHTRSQVIHTAWAVLALLEAEHPDEEAISRGVRFLITAQREDGSWPREDPAGLFFRTALLDYELYRSYFPVWALARFEQRRAGRRERSR
jgi:lanosterol synthase